MELGKILGYGLIYLMILFLFARVGLDVYKSRLRHIEQVDANEKNYATNVEQGQLLARALDDSRQSLREAIAALAMQKSLVLIADENGNWKLVALDTGSKDKVSEWLAQQRRDAEAAAKPPEPPAPATSE